MRPSKKLRIPSASLLLLLCALHIVPRAAAQVSCVVTYNCRSSQCAAAVGGPRTLNYPNEQACIDAAKTVGDGKIASCSCGSPTAPASGASTVVAPVAPGHEFDNTIHQAIAAGVAGKVSPGNAVGLIGLGLLGNALFAPKTTNPVQPEAQQQANLAAQQLNNSGLYLFGQRNYAGAINEFQKALAQSPNDASIINNLALAKQQLGIQQLNLKMATQTSGALAQLLGEAPHTTGLFGDQLPHSPVIDQNASPLSLVNLGSDPEVVDLHGATGISVDPESLKTQLDGVLANPTLPTAPPDPRAEMPQVEDIDLLFEPPQAVSQFPGPRRPANSPKLVNPMMDAEERAQVEAIFAQPGGLDDTLEKQALYLKANPATDPLLRDAVKDTSSDQNTVPGLFGSRAARPGSGDLTPAGPVVTPGKNTNASEHLKAAAAIGANGDLGKVYDKGGEKSPGPLDFPKAPGSQVPSVLPPDVPKQYLGDSKVVEFQRQWETARAEQARAAEKLQAIQEARKKSNANKGALDVAQTNADNDLSAANSKLSSAAVNIEDRVRILKRSFHEDRLDPPKE
jgi:tetratricopeptide (TPR) repeat protein